MSKVWKIILLAAALLIVAGIIMTAIALVNGGTFMRKSELTEKTYSFKAEEITSVDVYTVSDGVCILPAEGNEAVVRTMEDEKHTYEVTLKDGTLKVTYKGDKNGFGFFNFGSWPQKDQKVIVRLPAKLADSVKVSSVSGDLELQDIEASGALRASSTSGEIKLNNMHCKKDCVISSTSGEVELCEVEAGNSLKISSTSGRLVLDEVTAAGSIEMQSVSGRATLDKTAAGGDVSCSTTSGEISFTGLKGKSFSFNTVSGDISGTIAEKGSEFTASTGSVSGERSVTGSGSGQRSLQANTTSGDITVSFIG